MATEAGDAGKGYLHGLLADGACSFRFRGRIRVLLGLPESSGVQVNFSKLQPLGAFAYVLPRFSGEFAFPDEFLAKNPFPSKELVEGMVDLGHRRPLESVDRGQTKFAVHPGQAARPTVPPSVQPDDAVAKQPRASELKPSGEPAQQAPGSPSDRYFFAHEVVVPGVHPQPGSMPPSPTGTHEAVSPKPQGPVLKPAHSIMLTSDPAPKHSPAPVPGESLPARGGKSPSAPALPEAEGGVSPLFPFVPGSPVPQCVPFASQVRYAPSRMPVAKQNPAFHEFPAVTVSRKTGRVPGLPREDFSPIPAQAPSPLPRTRQVPAPAQPASPPPTQGRFALRQPDASLAGKERLPLGNYRQSPPDAPAGQTHVVPPTPPPVVVVQPLIGAGMTPSAFWERRHLGHLKVRIRR